MKRIVLLIFMISHLTMFSQEFLLPLQTNGTLEKNKKSFLIKSNTVTLPFLDDFSVLGPYPNSELWQDNHVFINRTYPVNPISLGVATFDGLDSLGYPYDISSNLDGYTADYLTSKPIDLSSLNKAFLIFYYQPKGIGDTPQPEDKFYLHFLTNSLTWVVIDSLEVDTVVSNFRKYTVIIDSSVFLHANFQFRFMNKATLSGNYDHWHIDYVKLDEFLASIDTSELNDVSFVYNSPSFLSRYREMPWGHFKNNISQELVDSINIKLRNNNAEEGLDYIYEVEEIGGSHYTIYPSIPPRHVDVWHYNDSGLYSFTSPPVTVIDSVFSSNVNSFASDSVSFLIRHIISPDTSTEIQSNDTLEHIQNFNSHFAYDDGSAEFAYGINTSGAMGAYQFKANRPDKLRAIQIYFPQMLDTVSSIDFYLTVWEDNNGKPGNIIYSSLENPKHTARSRYHHYYLDSILELPTGIFYVGWEQISVDPLNIGLDRNSPSNDYMFYNLGSSNPWYNSQFPGAWMIRPVLNNDSIFLSTYNSFSSLKIYPNPSRGCINIEFNFAGEKQIFLYNVNGKLIYSYVTLENHINIQEKFSSGLYLIKITTQQESFYEKIIVQ